MKKTAIRIFALTLAICFLMLAVVACGGSGVSGKYANEEGVVVNFKSGGELEMTYAGEDFGIDLSDALSLSGTYEIKGDKITVTLLGMEETMDFEKGSDYIIMDGERFNKQ